MKVAIVHHRCGIDVGSKTCKLVLLDELGHVRHAGVVAVGGDPDAAVRGCIASARKACKIKQRDMSILLTGRNARGIPSHPRHASELKCLASAASVFCPSVRTIIDSGAFTNKCIKIDGRGRILAHVVNDVCSSGAGIFLELVCKSLDIPLDRLGVISMGAAAPVPISSQCSIFAESEVIYKMNEGTPVADIAAGACLSVVGRIVPLVSRVLPEPDVLFAGGVGRDPFIRDALARELGHPVQVPPVDPAWFAAAGAALLTSKEGDG